jgi:hypothetical protein
MREVVLRVPASALEDVLDRLLPIVPGGVRERPLSQHNLELRMRGETVPALAQLSNARWDHCRTRSASTRCLMTGASAAWRSTQAT